MNVFVNIDCLTKGGQEGNLSFIIVVKCGNVSKDIDTSEMDTTCDATSLSLSNTKGTTLRNDCG